MIEERPVADIVDAYLAEARTRRASDIHFDPIDTHIRIRFRIDGILSDAPPLPRSIAHEVIARIKILAGLRTDEHHVAHDGRFRAYCSGTPLDVRVSITPTYYGESAVLRLLSGDGSNRDLSILGFSASDQSLIDSALKKSHGMILTTGPTGSGKTTTLYALLRQLHTNDVSIVTIEDPIEYAIAGIRQIPVNERSGLTFASGLRSLVRQDPDVIMVGEIRDRETADLAVNTALTGHLVLSTIHTTDAATTLIRLLDMRIEPYLIASTVTIAIAQRLVRRICEMCKEETPLSDAERESLMHMLIPQSDALPFFRGRGCENCGGSGYRGRIGICETLLVDDIMRELVLKKASARVLRASAIKKGMTPLLADGLCKAHAGHTTLSEIFSIGQE